MKYFNTQHNLNIFYKAAPRYLSMDMSTYNTAEFILIHTELQTEPKQKLFGVMN